MIKFKDRFTFVQFGDQVSLVANFVRISAAHVQEISRGITKGVVVIRRPTIRKRTIKHSTNENIFEGQFVSSYEDFFWGGLT